MIVQVLLMQDRHVEVPCTKRQSVRGFGKLKVQRDLKNALLSGQMDVLDDNKASHQMMLLLL